MIGLEHPNIMRVLEFGMVGRVPFIVMGYAPNGSLRKRHPRGNRLPLSTIVPYVRQVAAALQYVHDQKLIHRDIKSENMLVGRNNEVLLSDFGITAVAHSTRSMKTQDGSGTIYYMAPEQIQGKPRTASDQYSLGVVVYEWLTGDRPFNGTYWEVASQHLTTPPPSLRGKVPAIPPDVEKVVMTALAKDPKQRFASVQAFARALEQASQKPPMGTTLLTYRGHSSVVWHVAWSSDGSRIASASTDETVQVWNTTTGTKVITYREHFNQVYDAKWSPDSTRIASAGGLLKVWDASTGNTIFTCDTYDGEASEVAWSPDGARIVSVSGPPSLMEIWNTTTGDEIPYPGFHGHVRAVVWSPDGTRIVSGRADNTVQMWNATTGGKIYTYSGHSKPVLAVAWSSDGRCIASGSMDGIVQVWNPTTGSNTCTYYGHSGTVYSIAWSPDGTRIASGSWDGTAQVWNPTTGSKIYIYRGHSAGVCAVAWSPDGTRIASAGSDGTVQVWQAV